MKGARPLRALLLASASLLVLGGARHAQVLGGPQPPDFDWEQALGASIPLGATFVAEDGRSVALGEVFGERPVILALVYYECPMLCNLVMDGLVRSLKTLAFEPGVDYDVLAVSIDPGETPELALARRDAYVERLGRGDARGWHFLVGDEESIAALAGAVGFGFVYVPETDEYAHAAGITLLTPEGKVSRYFYGAEFAPRDLSFGLIEASEGTIGSPVEKFLLRCFSYDPARGRYGFAIMSAVRILGVVTVLVLGVLVVRMILRDRAGRRSNAEGASI